MIVIHYGTNKFNKKEFKPIKNSEYGNRKPYGGLWTSPIDSEHSWSEWCEGENYNTCSLKSNIQLKVKKSAKLYVIDSVEDMLKAPYYSTDSGRYIDFEKLVRLGYDGIHLTAKGERETRWPYHIDIDMRLCGWDVESVLLFNYNCVYSIYGKNKKQMN